MLPLNDNIHPRVERLEPYHDPLDFIFPMKLEEEEEDDFDEIEMLKKKQKVIRRELIEKKRSEDQDIEDDQT
jgi:hypothetical protein